MFSNVANVQTTTTLTFDKPYIALQASTSCVQVLIYYTFKP